MYTYLYIYVCICVYVHICICVYTYLSVHTHVHIYIHGRGGRCHQNRAPPYQADCSLVGLDAPKMCRTVWRPPPYLRPWATFVSFFKYVWSISYSVGDTEKGIRILKQQFTKTVHRVKRAPHRNCQVNFRAAHRGKHSANPIIGRSTGKSILPIHFLRPTKKAICQSIFCGPPKKQFANPFLRSTKKSNLPIHFNLRSTKKAFCQTNF